MKNKSATVYLIEDDQAVRDAIGSLTKAQGYRCVACSSAQEFLDSHDADQAGCLIIDTKLSGTSGLDVQKQLADKNVTLPVLVVSGNADVPTIVRAVRQGALDVIEKPINNKALLERIEEAVKQHRRLRKWELERKEVVDRENSLTPRETEVYRHMSEGKANRIIAEEMGISNKTLDIHRANVMRKMQAKTTGSLVRMSFLSKSKPDLR